MKTSVARATIMYDRTFVIFIVVATLLCKG